MTGRKYIRIALTPEDVDMFGKAKASWQRKSGVAMSDSMFALSIIRQRIDDELFRELLDGIDFKKDTEEPF